MMSAPPASEGACKLDVAAVGNHEPPFDHGPRQIRWSPTPPRSAARRIPDRVVAVSIVSTAARLDRALFTIACQGRRSVPCPHSRISRCHLVSAAKQLLAPIVLPPPGLSAPPSVCVSVPSNIVLSVLSAAVVDLMTPHP